MASTATCTMISLVIVLLAVFAHGSAIVPVAAPYASSYNSHTIHHNVATPVGTAPYVAAPYAAAPYAAAPYVAAPYAAAPYAAAPYVAAPYAAAPYAAAPYVASPYVAPASYPYLLK